jgi:hypothetical protein
VIHGSALVARRRRERADDLQTQRCIACHTAAESKEYSLSICFATFKAPCIHRPYIRRPARVRGNVRP